MELIDTKKYLFDLNEKFHQNIITIYKNLSYDQNIVINNLINGYNNNITGILTTQIYLYNDINGIKKLIEQAANDFIACILVFNTSLKSNIKNIVLEYTTSITSHILLQSIFKYNLNFKTTETIIKSTAPSFIIDTKGDDTLHKKNIEYIPIKKTKPIIHNSITQYHDYKKELNDKQADKLYNEFISSINIEDEEKSLKLCRTCISGSYCSKFDKFFFHIPKYVNLPPNKHALKKVIDTTKTYNDLYNINGRTIQKSGKIYPRLDICVFCLTASCNKLNDDKWHIPSNVKLFTHTQLLYLYNELYYKRKRSYYDERNDKYKQYKH